MGKPERAENKREVEAIEWMQNRLKREEKIFEQRLLRLKQSPDLSVSKLHDEFMSTFTTGAEKISKKKSLKERLAGRLTLLSNLFLLMDGVMKQPIKLESGGEKTELRLMTPKKALAVLGSIKDKPDLALEYRKDINLSEPYNP